MNNVTASKLSLLSKCNHWMWLDPDPELPDPYRDEGILRHDMIAQWITAGENYDAPWFVAFRDWYLASVPMAKASVEASYAIRPHARTARFLGNFLDRGYPEVPGEYPGTADLVLLLNREEAAVYDWKSDGTDYGDPADFGQLLGLSVAVMLAHGVKRVSASYVYLSNSGPHEVKSIITEKSIREFCDMLMIYTEANPEPVAGEHCIGQYCPSVGSCKGVRQRVAEVSPPIPETLSSGEDVAAWLQVKQLVEATVDRYNARARELCDASGGLLQLGNGRSYKRSEVKSKAIDREAIVAAMGSVPMRPTRFTRYSVTGKRSK